jgi:hypothetical protein
MAPQVVDAGERLRPRGGQALPHTDSDEEASGKPGASRDRDEVEVRRFCAGAVQGEINQVGQPLEVVARGQFGDDAAELFVQVDLRVDDIRQDAAAVLDDCDRRFVAACLDAEG